jgi:hypothetical protein
MSRLFGLDNVSLRRAEIYVNKSKGINCSYSFEDQPKWPLGKYVLDQLKDDKDDVHLNLDFSDLIWTKLFIFLELLHWFNWSDKL